MTKISELTTRQGNVEVTGVIKEIGEIRTFDKFGRQLKVADAVLEDESGAIKLSLWNQDTENFKVGDKVKIINGYVGEFQGEKQLTAGKFGKIEKIGKGETITPNEDIDEEESGEQAEAVEKESETPEGESEEEVEI